MKITGTVMNVNLSTNGGSMTISETAAAGPGSPTGGSRGVTINFTPAEGAAASALVGKKVTVEILELV